MRITILLAAALAAAFAVTLAATQPAATPASTAPIDPAALSRHVRMLASDEFEGRGPGTAGEQRTIAYLTEQFRAAGARPGGENGGWTQAVRMERHRVAEARTIRLAGPGSECSYDFGDSLVVWTRNAAPAVAIRRRASGLRRLRHFGARAELGRLCRRGCAREDRRGAGERSRS